MYYSIPLVNTVETPDGYMTSVPIEREGLGILLEHRDPWQAGPGQSGPRPATAASAGAGQR